MPALVGLFVLVQIVEIWLLIQVGHAIGGWQTLLLLVLDSILGAALLRRQGRRTWRAFRLALEERRLPAKEVADGALVLVGGTLLLTPGFLSDIVGVLCLLPPTRSLLRPMLTRVVARRLGVAGLSARRGARSRPASYDVIDGEVVDGPSGQGQTHEGPPPRGRRP
ncbi:MAG: FxsA cytoplasmic rane protein [Frankiales bacterium]|nr:FxsA cytoplasmic rane protein [Frankiales bacterium]